MSWEAHQVVGSYRTDAKGWEGIEGNGTAVGGFSFEGKGEMVMARSYEVGVSVVRTGKYGNRSRADPAAEGKDRGRRVHEGYEGGKYRRRKDHEGSEGGWIGGRRVHEGSEEGWIVHRVARSRPAGTQGDSRVDNKGPVGKGGDSRDTSGENIRPDTDSRDHRQADASSAFFDRR